MSRENPFLRPGDTPQQSGGRFENFWAKLLGVKPQRGSGNQWTAPMDVGDGSILWSLKFSTKDVLRFGSKRMKDLMREIESHTKGSDTIPAVATRDEDGQTWVTFRADDFIRMCETGAYKYIVPSKAEQKRARSKVPTLLRDDP